MKTEERSLVFHPNYILDALGEMAQENGWKMESQPRRAEFHNEWGQMEVELIFNKKEFATFKVQQLPGCCAVLVANHIMPSVFTREAFDDVLTVIETAAFKAGFGSLMMAQVLNKAEDFSREVWSKCIEGGDWITSVPFVNAKSGNKVVYLTKNLGQPGQRSGLEHRTNTR